MSDVVRKIGTEDLTDAAGTAGIHRWLAATDRGFWAGIATTDPGAESGWHHHSDNHTLAYVVEGRMRIEWGAQAQHSVEASAGEFVHVPPHTVHREMNPDPAPARVVVVRIGEGEPVVNVAAAGS